MKIAIVLAAAALTLGATETPADYTGPLTPTADGWRAIDLPNERSSGEAACRDRIRMARAERGLPQLERETASSDDPMFIAAVDHRLDGCGVLVMRNDTGDIRPVPAVPMDRPLLMPAR